MHGLINRAIQCFVRDTYGQDCWLDIAQMADLSPPDFEAMLRYEDRLTFDVLQACGNRLGKPRDELLEDLGTYLVSNPNSEALRRLLRFGGDSFVEFLHSLDDLPERAWLAVPDLELPLLDLQEVSQDQFLLTCHSRYDGFAPVLLGMLRSLADDYGALVLLEMTRPTDPDVDGAISIALLETAFSEGRHFELGAGVA